jgi:hypothetical protein
MKKLLILTLAVVVALPLLGWLLLASAQENADKKAPDAAAKKGENPEASRYLDAPPDLRSTSSISFKQEGKEVRVVGISPQLKTSKNYVKGLRFSRILGALAERETPIEDGLPKIIDGIRRNPDGSVWLRFRVIVTTPEFQKRCRDAVLAEERGLLQQEGLTQEDIRIEPWPLKHCVVSMQDGFSKEIIAVSQTGTLTGTKEEFNFTMQFSPEELRKVIGLIRKGEIEFVYTYSYVGSTEHKGEVDLKGVKNAKLIASQKLRSEQIEGKEPIFGGEANEAVRHVYVTVQKTMRATHKDLIPLLDQLNLYQKLFIDDGEINLKDLKDGDEKTAAMIAAYLTPRLEQVRESYGGEKSDIKIHEDKMGEAEKGSWNLSGQGGITIPIKMIPVSLGFGGGLGKDKTKTKEVLDRVEAATSSKWGYDKATERFRPHSIRKVKFQKGADEVLINEKTTVFLSVGPENRYLEETPIPVTFTTKTTCTPPGSELGAYEGVPLGAMVPYFGTKLPKGYVWADGVANWPNADWVPTHLRGAKVPDMQENLVGGAKNMDAVGHIFDEGQIVLGARTIPGTAFKLPSPSRRDIDEASDTNGGIGVVRIAKKNAQGKWGYWCGGGADFDIQHGYYRGYFGDEGMKGSHELPEVRLKLDSSSSNPRHVMCRWIIRVK